MNTTVKWNYFHHPKWNAELVKRRLADEVMDVLYLFGEEVAHRLLLLLRDQCGRTELAERRAANRLRSRGLTVTRRGLDGVSHVSVSPTWNPPEVLTPDRLWKQPWGGIWFVLMYDVAEANRSARDILRRWLKRLRMGCLQKSVWITPWDIRPDYADLMKATGLGLGSYLLESRATLVHTDADMVAQAWDWERIGRQHAWYLDGIHPLLAALKSNHCHVDDMSTLIREELGAYRAAMEGDPLLPRALHPPHYRGGKVVDAHQEWVRRTGRMFGGPSVF